MSQWSHVFAGRNSTPIHTNYNNILQNVINWEKFDTDYQSLSEKF